MNRPDNIVRLDTRRQLRIVKSPPFEQREVADVDAWLNRGRHYRIGPSRAEKLTTIAALALVAWVIVYFAGQFLWSVLS